MILIEPFLPFFFKSVKAPLTRRGELTSEYSVNWVRVRVRVKVRVRVRVRVRVPVRVHSDFFSGFAIEFQ